MAEQVVDSNIIIGQATGLYNLLSIVKSNGIGESMRKNFSDIYDVYLDINTLNKTNEVFAEIGTSIVETTFKKLAKETKETKEINVTISPEEVFIAMKKGSKKASHESQNVVEKIFPALNKTSYEKLSVQEKLVLQEASKQATAISKGNIATSLVNTLTQGENVNNKSKESVLMCGLSMGNRNTPSEFPSQSVSKHIMPTKRR